MKLSARTHALPLFDDDAIPPGASPSRTVELRPGDLRRILRALLYARRAGNSCSSRRLEDITPLWREALNVLATRGRLSHCEQRGTGWLVILLR